MERIKERVEEKEGIPPQQQRLIYSGKQMWALFIVFPRLWCPVFFLQPAHPSPSLFPGTTRRRQRTIRSRAAPSSTWYWLWEEARRSRRRSTWTRRPRRLRPNAPQPQGVAPVASDSTRLRWSGFRFGAGTSQLSTPRTSRQGFFGRSRCQKLLTDVLFSPIPFAFFVLNHYLSVSSH